MKLGKLIRAITLTGILSTTTCVTGNTPPPEPPTLVSRINDTKNELYRIGTASTNDNIERGGIGVIENGQLIIYEIENDVRADEERYSRFARGDNGLYAHLLQRIQTASAVQSICTPESAQAFAAIAGVLTADLSRILMLQSDTRESEAALFYPRFDAQVRHHMYIAESGRTEELKNKERAFCFHTHWNGSPPSEVDVQLSHTRPEVVVSISPLSRIIYYIENGNTTIVHQDNPTAMR